MYQVQTKHLPRTSKQASRLTPSHGMLLPLSHHHHQLERRAEEEGAATPANDDDAKWAIRPLRGKRVPHGRSASRDNLVPSGEGEGGGAPVQSSQASLPQRGGPGLCLASTGAWDFTWGERKSGGLRGMMGREGGRGIGTGGRLAACAPVSGEVNDADLAREMSERGAPRAVLCLRHSGRVE